MGGPNWSLADGKPIGWADVNEDDILAGIKAGLDAGVTHFDNADIYGNGRAERMLRDCLKKLGVSADSVVIATKMGHFQGTAEHQYDPHHIRRQCEQSLRNLGVDCIDVYYFHHGNFGADGELGNIHDAAGVMRELVAEGKVRAVGQSAYTDEHFAKAIPVVKPDVLQSRASMLFQECIRPGCKVQQLMDEHGCSFVGFSPLGQGLLLDKFDPENPPAFETGDIRGQRMNQFDQQALRSLKPKLEKLGERFGTSIEERSSAASRFVAGHANVCSVIPGFRNERQALCNVRAGGDDPMTEADLAFVREVMAG